MLRTGGYIYDRRVIEALGAAGRDAALLRLPEGFPHPDHAAQAGATVALAAVPAECALIVDGLALGALEPGALDRVAAPIVALIHHPLALETGLDPARAEALAASERRNLGHAAAVVVPSPHTAETLVARYAVDPARITVAPPGTDPARLPRRPDAPPLILSVGSLVPRKGHDVLIDALAGLADLPWQAVIAGAMADPGRADALARQADAAGLSRRLRFAGAVEDADLQDLYARATVFALATRYEGYGMVFAEALSHGVPVVSCRVGAVPGTVPEAAGLLVPPDDPAAFGAALRTVLGVPARRAALTAGAAHAGAALPRWGDTAARIAAVVDAL